MNLIPTVRETSGEKESRNGPTIEFPVPFSTTYTRPMERVLWDTTRDANPFFHLIESLWMLAGRNDTKFLTDILSRMGEFSDDGVVFNAAYGYRWRNYFERDQLDDVVKMLVEDPMSRRVVLQIWDIEDLGRVSKDLPCNVGATFSTRSGKLDMAVFNRSNDIILGAYGANVVHFSFLQEYIARRVGVEVGNYTQISTNFHVYVDNFKKVYTGNRTYDDLYLNEKTTIHPLMDKGQEHMFDSDVTRFCNSINFETESYDNSFFKHIAVPVRVGYEMWKDGHRREALQYLLSICETDDSHWNDWMIACRGWMNRRIAKDKS